jgi:hypothetical protein
MPEDRKQEGYTLEVRMPEDCRQEGYTLEFHRLPLVGRKLL